MQLERIVTDKDGKEIVERGTPLFPLSVHDNDMHAFPSHFVPWHWHDECEVVHVVDGELVLELPGVKTTLKAGSAAFINSNVLHAMRPASQDQCRAATIAFGEDIVGGAPSSVYRARYVLPVLHDERFHACILDGSSAWEREAIALTEQIEAAHAASQFGYELRIRNLLSDIWLLLLANAETAMDEAPSPDPYIRKLLTYVHTNYGNELTLESIAASAGVSVRTCTRSFRQQLQMSVFGYVNEYRIKKAAEQLLMTDATVTEICFACGFSDPGYFSRRFRVQTGMTPREYRRTAGAGKCVAPGTRSART